MTVVGLPGNVYLRSGRRVLALIVSSNLAFRRGYVPMGTSITHIRGCTHGKSNVSTRASQCPFVKYKFTVLFFVFFNNLFLSPKYHILIIVFKNWTE